MEGRPPKGVDTRTARREPIATVCGVRMMACACYKCFCRNSDGFSFPFFPVPCARPIARQPIPATVPYLAFHASGIPTRKPFPASVPPRVCLSGAECCITISSGRFLSLIFRSSSAHRHFWTRFVKSQHRIMDEDGAPSDRHIEFSFCRMDT